MKMRKLSLLLLLGGAGRAQAQLPPATEPPRAPLRWLLGGQVGVYPRMAQSWNAGDAPARPWPVQLLARGQRERIGVEAGLLLRGDPAQEIHYTTPDGTATTRTTSRTWLVTLASRYRLAPQRPARWRLDAELGFLYVSSRAGYTTTFVEAGTGRQATTGSGTNEYNDLPLLGGLGFTYQLTPHLALTADARAGWSYIGTALVQIFTQNSSYVTPLMPVCGVGASYTLGHQLSN